MAVNVVAFRPIANNDVAYRVEAGNVESVNEEFPIVINDYGELTAIFC
jgi:hypothetical protein